MRKENPWREQIADINIGQIRIDPAKSGRSRFAS